MSDTIVGDWSEGGPRAITGTEISVRALELVAHWKRCGLTADWLAGFFAYDFEIDCRDAAASVLATTINEVIENAAKFCADKSAPITIAVRHHGDFIRIETRNRANATQAANLRAAMMELATSDLGELFARRIEHQSEPGASGLGLLILKKDYHAKLGVKLVPAGTESDVHVQVTLDTEEVSGR